MNDRLMLSHTGAVLDPVDWRLYEGPVKIVVYPDRIEVRALLDARITDLGYALADAAAVRSGEA